MKNALQEQLLKAGLATEEQLRQARRGKRRPPAQKAKRKGRGAPPRARGERPPRDDGAPDLAAAWAARRKLEAEERRQAKEAAARRKANRRKVRELIQSHALNDPAADLPYQFQVGATIKRLYVTAEQRRQLLAGELAITFLDGRRCLIPAAVAEHIRALDPDKIVIRHEPAPEPPPAEDDPYAGYEVPDDLIW